MITHTQAVTVRLAHINDEVLNDSDDWGAGTTSWDQIDVYGQAGDVIAIVAVKSSDDSQPYDEALRAAGWLNFTWE